MISPDDATETAPDTYSVELTTTKGTITIDVDRDLAPIGADRFYNLVKLGFYDDVAFFRVVPAFMAQAGLSGTPAVNKAWRNARIRDDAPKTSNSAGTVTFATSGKDSRTTQFFINLKSNARLDAMGFAPFGKVRDLSGVEQLHDGYGDSPPSGSGPMQGRLHREGNAYLQAEFPELDYIRSAKIVD